MAQYCLDDYCYLGSTNFQNIRSELNKGYRAFRGKASDFTDINLKILESFLRSNPEEIVSLFVEDVSENFNQKLETLGLWPLVYRKGSLQSGLELQLDSQQRLFVFSVDSSQQFLNFDQYGSWLIHHSDDTTTTPFSDTPKSLIVLHDQWVEEGNIGQEKQLKRLDNIINHSGKLPNFMFTKKPEVFKDYFDSLNSVGWFRAIALENGKKLSKVYWKNLPLVSTGKVHLKNNNISPEKKGYWFSPDLVRFNLANSETVKIFEAYRYDLSDGLKFFLDFQNGTDNNVDVGSRSISSNVEIIEDEERGLCAKFNGNGSYIDLGHLSEVRFETITVSAWIKPTKLDGNRSIVGKGEAFSAKCRDGLMLFTTPDIRDHVGENASVKLNEWQHLAFVYSENREILFYINGELVGSTEASEMEYTHQSLLVGTNLWDEYYAGLMDDLKIWSRALSDEEIKKIYDTTPEDGTRDSAIWYIAGILLASSIAFFIYRKTRSDTVREIDTIANKHFPPQIDKAVLRRPGASGTSLTLFGGFKLMNSRGEDLTPQFSPRRKELFTLILLNSIKDAGITSNKMAQILWPGHTQESVKNNRSTLMHRIREILSDNTGISIDYTDKKWKVSWNEDVHVDLAQYYQLTPFISRTDQNGIKKKHDALKTILAILNNGQFLPAMDLEWLDTPKSALHDEILDLLLPLLGSDLFGDEPEIQLEISDALLLVDPLSEPAIETKIKVLVTQGKHALAKETLDHYQKVYQSTYGEPSQKTFADIFK
ncbi:hypothetical protein QQ008_06725 [Fulvivirgaceae bacterium BMA10]|uniref:LamG-like jellyroll fold domain-containing protein n=1 Tax=Splendidivirga corallicola TaxID=3051826 RepID=A0ABT8KND3_9BACT|nr:hypothetical protein [Fulvivirgaceae bacterium BMA10]